jgi:hypothetical protein
MSKELTKRRRVITIAMLEEQIQKNQQLEAPCIAAIATSPRISTCETN